MSELSVAGAPEEDLKLRESMDSAETLERRLFVALAGGVLLAVSWIASLVGKHPEVAQLPAAVGGDHPRHSAALRRVAGDQPGPSVERLARDRWR